jgi:oligopeptidase B
MSEWHYFDASKPDEALRLIEPRRTDHEYDVSDHNERFFIRTNIDGAKDFKIVETVISTPTSDKWGDFIAYEPGRLITDFLVFKDYLAVEETHAGLPQIRVLALETNESRYIKFDDEVYDAELVSGREFDTNTLRFTYTSLAIPTQVYDYDMPSGQRVLRKEQEVLGDFHRGDYLSRRLFAKTSDGVDVPISILYRKATPLDGTAPLLLYGYGSYGNSIPASFSSTRFSYVNRGFVYAIAHIRGGMELGYDWYESGKLMQKQNTFNDYIACAETLISQRRIIFWPSGVVQEEC